MCHEAVRREPYALELIPDHFKTQEMCDTALKEDPYMLNDVPGRNLWRGSDERSMHTGINSCSGVILQWGKTHTRWNPVADWFVRQVKIWNDDDDKLTEWYDGYQKRKAQKTKIEEELIFIAWHPSRWWIGVFLKTRKKRGKNFRHKYGVFCVWWLDAKGFFWPKRTINKDVFCYATYL